MRILPRNDNDLRSGLNRLLKIVLVILPLAFAGNIIYTLLTSELDTLVELLAFKAGYLLLAVLLCLMPWFGQTIRIIIWSGVFKKPVSPLQSLKAVLSSDIAAAATPTMLGGGYAKAGYLVSYGYSAGEATIITLLGTIEDAVFFIIALPLAVIWSRAWDNPYVRQAGTGLISHWPVVLIVIAAISVIFIILNNTARLKNPRPNADTDFDRKSAGGRFITSLRKYRSDLASAMRFAIGRGKAAFVLAVIFAGIGWCSRYGAISALVYGLGLDADPVLFFLLQWVVFTTMTMIPTPGAIGGAEVSFTLVYSGLLPAYAVPLVTSGWRFITFYLPLAMGSVIFSVLGGASLKKDNVAVITDTEKTKPAVLSENTGE